ncbi:MAG: CocE/NonD family hydrolase [Aquabacterium sp.]
MKTLWRVLAVLAILVLAGAAIWRQALIANMPPDWRIAAMAWRKGVTVDHGIVIQMPDGVRLRASLYRPRHVQGPLPTILVRVPYKRKVYGEAYNSGLFFAAEGYAVIVQDLRGTGDSEGELLPWAHAAEDGAATLDWITHQPWSTGKVGTFGCSALGETQMVLSKLNHPAHLAMIPSGAGGGVGSAAGRYSYFGLYEGGVYQLASGFGWFSWAGTKAPHAPPAPAFDHVKTLRELPISALVQRVRPAPNGYGDFLGHVDGRPALGHATGLPERCRSSGRALAHESTHGAIRPRATRWPMPSNNAWRASSRRSSSRRATTASRKSPP